MKKILISENTQTALAAIENLTKTAGILNGAITRYNDVEAFDPITQKDDAIAYFKSPKTFIDTVVISNLAGVLKKKITPDPAQLAAMYGIPYYDLIKSGEVAGRYPAQNFAFVDGCFVVTDEMKEREIEAAKEYTRDERETKAYKAAQDLADHLNEYLNIFAVSSLGIGEVVRRFNLKYETHTSTVHPHIGLIRESLKNGWVTL